MRESYLGVIYYREIRRYRDYHLLECLHHRLDDDLKEEAISRSFFVIATLHRLGRQDPSLNHNGI